MNSATGIALASAPLVTRMPRSHSSSLTKLADCSCTVEDGPQPGHALQPLGSEPGYSPTGEEDLHLFEAPGEFRRVKGIRPLLSTKIDQSCQPLSRVESNWSAKVPLFMTSSAWGLSDIEGILPSGSRPACSTG